MELVREMRLEAVVMTPVTMPWFEVKTYSMCGMRNVTLFYKGMAVLKVGVRTMGRRTRTDARMTPLQGGR